MVVVEKASGREYPCGGGSSLDITVGFDRLSAWPVK